MLDLQTKLSNAPEIMLFWQGSSILNNYEKNIKLLCKML